MSATSHLSKYTLFWRRTGKGTASIDRLAFWGFDLLCHRIERWSTQCGSGSISISKDSVSSGPAHGKSQSSELMHHGSGGGEGGGGEGMFSPALQEKKRFRVI